jgi:hypothetical protein
MVYKKKGKVISVPGCGGPQGCDKTRLPHFPDSQLTDGSEAVSLTHWLPFTPRKIPGSHFCYSLNRPQDHSAAGRIRSTEISNALTENRTCDLPACSIAPQQMLPCAPHENKISITVHHSHFPDYTFLLCGPLKTAKLRFHCSTSIRHDV